MVTQHSAAQDLAEAQPQTSQTDDFAALLTREFRPRSERAGEEVRLAVRTLAEQVLERSDIISDDLAQTINAYVAEIDRKISEQLNLILHAPQFQALEGAWRGLHYLVSNTESDTQLKIRVLNVSKGSSPRTSSASRAPPGTRARYSRKFTKPSTASWVANPTAV